MGSGKYRRSFRAVFPAGTAERSRWLKVRDQIYEEIMSRGWNKEYQAFTHIALISAAFNLGRALGRQP